MPWDAGQATEHTHAANTPVLKSLWSRVANRILAETGSDRRALSGAAAAVNKKKAGG